jgi:membrane-associated phospholipid phosphatase
VGENESFPSTHVTLLGCGSYYQRQVNNRKTYIFVSILHDIPSLGKEDPKKELNNALFCFILFFFVLIIISMMNGEL